MRENQKHSLPHLQHKRTALRQSLTTAEAVLWNALKNKQLRGRKFRKQHSIENYIPDFYCASEKLIIELDGEVHNNVIAAQNDFERDQKLRTLGFTVLRFENYLILKQLENVLAEIERHFTPYNSVH